MFTKRATLTNIRPAVLSSRNKTAEAISGFDFEPDPAGGYLYVTSRALTSDIPNLNYDMFPHEEMQEAYKTFIGCPVFVDHHNTDDTRARGVILDAKYHDEDPEDRWTEILMELDEVTFPELCRLVRDGEIDTMSMGCTVESTTCSVCGNEAADFSEFCNHINQKGATFDGELAYEICHGIDFIEESFVYDPADVNAQVGEINANYEERVAKMSSVDGWNLCTINPAANLGGYRKIFDTPSGGIVADVERTDWEEGFFYLRDGNGNELGWGTYDPRNSLEYVLSGVERAVDIYVETDGAYNVFCDYDAHRRIFSGREKSSMGKAAGTYDNFFSDLTNEIDNFWNVDDSPVWEDGYDENGTLLAVGDVIDGPNGCYVLAEEEESCFEAYEYGNFEAGTWTLWKDDLGEYAKIDSVDESPWIAEEYMISANRKLTSGLELNWHQDPINFEWTAFFGGGNLACVEPDSMMSSFGEETWVATVYDVNDTNLFWGMYDTAEEGKAKCEEYISSHGLVASRSAQVNIDSDMYDNEEDLAEAIVDALQSTDYEDLGPALNDICNDPKLFAVLRDLFGGGIGTLELSSTEVAVPVADLYPCQNEIGLDNSLAYPLEGNTDIGVYFNDPVTIVRPIVTYEGTYIIDGHHRWSQVFMLNPDAEITALDITGGNLDPTEVLRIAQGAIAAANGSVPSSSSQGINVYDSSDDEIWSYIDNTMVESAEEGMEEETGIEGREAVIEYICENVDELKTQHGPTSGAPDRDYMPQTDDGSLDLLDKGVEEI